RRIERMMRIRKGRPQAEGLVLVIAQIIQRPVAYPRRVMPSGWQCRMPGLDGARQRRQTLGIKRRAFIAPAVRMVPALVVLTLWRLHRRPLIMTFQHEFHVLETHIGPGPVGRV